MLNQSLTLLTLSLILAMLVGCKDIPSTDSITNTAAPTTTLPTEAIPSQPDQPMPSQPTESIATLAATYRNNSYYIDIANDGHFEIVTNQILTKYDYQQKTMIYIGESVCRITGVINSVETNVAGYDPSWIKLNIKIDTTTAAFNKANKESNTGCMTASMNEAFIYHKADASNCIGTGVIGAISTGGLGFQNITYCK